MQIILDEEEWNEITQLKRKFAETVNDRIESCQAIVWSNRLNHKTGNYWFPEKAAKFVTAKMDELRVPIEQ